MKTLTNSEDMMEQAIGDFTDDIIGDMQHSIDSMIDTKVEEIEDEIRGNYINVYGEQAWEDFVNDEKVRDAIRSHLTENLEVRS